jgi:hypothetical protein
MILYLGSAWVCAGGMSFGSIILSTMPSGRLSFIGMIAILNLGSLFFGIVYSSICVFGSVLRVSMLFGYVYG